MTTVQAMGRFGTAKPFTAPDEVAVVVARGTGPRVDGRLGARGGVKQPGNTCFARNRVPGALRGGERILAWVLRCRRGSGGVNCR